MAKLILNVANPETICGEAAQEVKFEQNSASADGNADGRSRKRQMAPCEFRCTQLTEQDRAGRSLSSISKKRQCPPTFGYSISTPRRRRVAPRIFRITPAPSPSRVVAHPVLLTSRIMALPMERGLLSQHRPSPRGRAIQSVPL